MTLPAIARVLLLAGLATGAARAGALPELVVNDTNAPPYTTAAGDGSLDVLAGAAFRCAGVGLRLVKLPAGRALRAADAGIIDGDLVRIAGIEKNHANLMRVPEKLVDWRFAAYSRNAALPAQWAVLRRQRVGYIRGWKIYERALAGAPHVTAVDDAAQLFRLLDLGRIEVALYAQELGEAHLRQQGMSGVRRLEPPLATQAMFIYLHRRHVARVPRIAAALRALKAGGDNGRPDCGAAPPPAAGVAL